MDFRSLPSLKKSRPSSSETSGTTGGPSAEVIVAADRVRWFPKPYRLLSPTIENIIGSVDHDPPDPEFIKYMQEHRKSINVFVRPSTRIITSSSEDGELQPTTESMPTSKRSSSTGAGMISSLFGFFGTLFGVGRTIGKTTNLDGTAKHSTNASSMGVSLMVFVAATIVVVILLKREQSQNIRPLRFRHFALFLSSHYKPRIT